MRTACLHLPAFPLQVHLRGTAHRPGAAIAVVAGAPVPIVVACSRAARAAGVSVGMAASAAREIASDIEIVAADLRAEREAARAIAEALAALSPRVDPGGAPTGPHHAIYAEVPPRMRGAAFGAKALALLETMGASGRVGIADDRFTARVAATTGAVDVVSVPRGGSAAFLAPLPLGLLAISHEVRHMLETLGVRTLGEFAALPPPSVARPEDADWQALARGDGGAAIAAFRPVGPIVERVAIGDGGAVDAIGALAARVAARLAGRGGAAAAIELAVREGEPAVTIVPDAPIDARAELAGAIAAHVAPSAGPTAPGAGWIEARVRVIASGGEVTAPIVAEGSAPLRLVPDVAPMLPIASHAAHRRTRRGKDRLRVARGGVQAALFASLEVRAR